MKRSRDSKTHLRKYSPEQSIICLYCSKEFSKHFNYKRHHNKIHSNLKSEQKIKWDNKSTETLFCPHCRDDFLPHQKRFFINHLLICRYNPARKQKRYSCPLCTKNFPSRSSLVTHRRRMHQIENEEIMEEVDRKEQEEREEEEEEELIDAKKMKEIERSINSGKIDFMKLIKFIDLEQTYSDRFETTIDRTIFEFTPLSKQLCRKGYILDVIYLVLNGLLKRFQLSNSEAIQIVLDSPLYLG